jgi:hypothetical protein
MEEKSSTANFSIQRGTTRFFRLKDNRARLSKPGMGVTDVSRGLQAKIDEHIFMPTAKI